MLVKSRQPGLYAEPALPRWWDLLVIAATVTALVLLGLDLFYVPEPWLGRLLEWLDLSLCALFLLDFYIRFRLAPLRREFLARNWIDLVAAIPLVGPLRVGRAVRLVRLLRLTRIALLTRRVLRRFEMPGPAVSLGFLGGITLMLCLVSGTFFYLFESATNPAVKSIEDSIWWGMTTLSTVGYGDIYPTTTGGRIVAAMTMALGIGVLGSFAGTISTVVVEARERRRRGLGSYVMQEHLLILGWSEKAKIVFEEFSHTERFRDSRVVVVAELETSPIDHPRARFVRGHPGRREVLERASAQGASAAVILASNPVDPRSDHETVLNVLALRRLNPKIRISAELISPENREHLEMAGCDVIIDPLSLAGSLLTRSVLDEGISDIVRELLSARVGAEVYRVPVPGRFLGKSYRELVHSMVDRSAQVLAIARGKEMLLAPGPGLVLQSGDYLFLVAHSLPDLESL
jgi:voltage-gated potassium channel